MVGTGVEVLGAAGAAGAARRACNPIAKMAHSEASGSSSSRSCAAGGGFFAAKFQVRTDTASGACVV